MPLTFTYADVADFENVCLTTDARGRSVIEPITDALIWLSMTIGLNAITSANTEEWILRVTETEERTGARLYLWPENPPVGHAEPQPRPITAEEIRVRVGLRTNAAAKTRTTWRRDLDRTMARETAARR